MEKRAILYLSTLLLVIITLLGFMPVHQAQAVDPDNWNHVIPFTITDTGGTDRTNVPVIITYDVNGKLVAYGLTNATTTNTYMDSSGASNSPIGTGTAYDYLIATSNITAIIPSLPAYSTVTLNLYTGYSPVQTTFPIIIGTSGLIGTSDAAPLEIADSGDVQIVDGYVDTTAGSNKYLFQKQWAIETQVSAASTLTARAYNYGDAFTADSWTDSGSGKISVSGGYLNYESERSASDDRCYYDLGAGVISDTSWVMNFTWKAQSQAGGNNALVYFGAFESAANMNGYTDDGIGVILYGTSVKLRQWDEGVDTSSATAITVTNPNTYYATLKRTSATTATFALYSDSARTTAVTGSPLSLAIPSTNQGLRYLQASNYNDNHGAAEEQIGWFDNVAIGVETSVSSVSSGEYTVTTTVSGGNLTLDVDGDSSSVGFVGDVFDNAQSWTFLYNNALSYATAITENVSGSQVLWYQPTALISSNTLPDRATTDGTQNGTITWGANSNMTVTGGSITDSESATSVGVTSAMMQGELFYIGTYSSVYESFQYGLDDNYGYSTSETAATVAGTYGVTLTGLTPNTTYHFRAITRSASVYSYGADTTFTTAYSTASEGSTTPLIQNIGVFSGYQTTGDLLFAAEVVLTYPPYYPTDLSYKYFQMQLIDTDGSTILGASPISQWGDRPSSIYLNPTVASGLTYGAAYEIRIANVSSDNITVNTSDTFSSNDWYGTDLTRLDDWCIGVAWSMQNNDGTLLTDPYVKAETGYGVIITNTAGGYFTKGIPNITKIRPALFTVGEHAGDTSTPSSTITYPGKTLTQQVGSHIVNDATTVGDVFSISGQQFLFYMILAVMLFCIIFTVSRTQGFGALGATILTIPIVGASAYFNIMSIALPVGALVILAWLFVRQFVWKTM